MTSAEATNLLISLCDAIRLGATLAWALEYGATLPAAWKATDYDLVMRNLLNDAGLVTRVWLDEDYCRPSCPYFICLPCANVMRTMYPELTMADVMHAVGKSQ